MRSVGLVAVVAIMPLVFSSPAEAQMQIYVDSPGAHVGVSFTVSGVALDWRGPYIGQPGIKRVVVCINSGTTCVQALGDAQIALPRADFAAAYGEWARYSGFAFAATLTPGSYTIGLFSQNILDEWHVQTVSTVVHGAPQIVVDRVTTGRQPFVVTGAAGDLQSPSGPGIDMFEVWADRIGGSSTRITEVTLFLPRPEYAGTQFANAGWSARIAGLPEGAYNLRVIARGSYTGYVSSVTVPVWTKRDVRFYIDLAAGSTVLQPFSVTGAVGDLAALPSQGTGVSTVEIRAIPNGASAPSCAVAGCPIVTQYRLARPDVVPPELHPQFLYSGFSGTVNNPQAIAPGQWLLEIAYYSTVNPGWEYVYVPVAIDMKVAAPVVTPASGTYDGPITVTVRTETAGATIRYEIGSPPQPVTRDSAIFPEAVEVSTSVSANVRAFLDGWIDSDTVPVSYRIRPQAPQFTVAPGVYFNELDVEFINRAPGSVIRYTLDGNPTEYEYSGRIRVDRSHTIRARAYTSEFPEGSNEVTATYELRVPTVQATPEPGTHISPLWLALGTHPVASAIHFTVNGPPPTSDSEVYTGAKRFDAPGTYTIRAIARRDGWTTSALATFVYVVELPTLSVPIVSPNGGVVPSGSEVTITHPDPLATIMYTASPVGQEPPSIFTPYSAPLRVDESFVIRAKVIRSGYNDSSIVSATFQAALPAPELDPPAGTYSNLPFYVRASVPGNYFGIQLRYTLDSSEPNADSELVPGYGVLVSHNTTLKVGAFRGSDIPWITTASYISIAEPEVIAYGSPGVLQLMGGAETVYRSTADVVSFTLNGASFAEEPIVTHNDTEVSDDRVSVGINSLSISNSLVEGENEFLIFGLDSLGRVFEFSQTIWAGSRSVTVTVRDRQTGSSLGNAVVTLRHPTGTEVAQTTGSGGTATFLRVPTNLPVAVAISMNGFRTEAYEWSPSTLPITLSTYLERDDQAFILGPAGLAGWSVAGQVATLLESEEPRGWEPCPTCVPRLGAASALNTAQADGLVGDEGDLMLTTRDQLPSITSVVQRTLKVLPGADAVRIRYRVSSWEAVSGSYYPDWYSVHVQSLTTGAVVQDTRTIQQVTFVSNGTTAWMMLTMPVTRENEEFLVSFQVGNGIDAAFETNLEVDYVQDAAPRIESAELHDVRAPNGAISELKLLSMSQHSYAQSRTRVFGAIHLSGSANEMLASLNLQVIDAAGRVVATGNLAPEAAALLTGRALSTQPRIIHESSAPLFDFPASEFAAIDQSGEELFRLQIIGTTSAGRQIRGFAVQTRVQKLVRYTGNRHGIEDLEYCMSLPTVAQQPLTLCYGDQWANPLMKNLAMSIQSVTVGGTAVRVRYRDFANMNGGLFPPHGTHGEGRTFDVTIDGYEARDSAAGERLIAYAQRVVAAMPTNWTLGRICVDYAHRQDRSPISALQEHMNRRSGPEGDWIGTRRPNEVFIDCNPDKDEHHTHIHIGVRKVR